MYAARIVGSAWFVLLSSLVAASRAARIASAGRRIASLGSTRTGIASASGAPEDGDDAHPPPPSPPPPPFPSHGSSATRSCDCAICLGPMTFVEGVEMEDVSTASCSSSKDHGGRGAARGGNVQRGAGGNIRFSQEVDRDEAAPAREDPQTHQPRATPRGGHQHQEQPHSHENSMIDNSQEQTETQRTARRGLRRVVPRGRLLRSWAARSARYDADPDDDGTSSVARLSDGYRVRRGGGNLLLISDPAGADPAGEEEVVPAVLLRCIRSSSAADLEGGKLSPEVVSSFLLVSPDLAADSIRQDIVRASFRTSRNETGASAAGGRAGGGSREITEERSLSDLGLSHVDEKADENDDTLVLPCGHRFHRDCILQDALHQLGGRAEAAYRCALCRDAKRCVAFSVFRASPRTSPPGGNLRRGTSEDVLRPLRLPSAAFLRDDNSSGMFLRPSVSSSLLSRGSGSTTSGTSSGGSSFTTSSGGRSEVLPGLAVTRSRSATMILLSPVNDRGPRAPRPVQSPQAPRNNPSRRRLGLFRGRRARAASRRTSSSSTEEDDVREGRGTGTEPPPPPPPDVYALHQMRVESSSLMQRMQSWRQQVAEHFLVAMFAGLGVGSRGGHL